MEGMQLSSNRHISEGAPIYMMQMGNNRGRRPWNGNTMCK